MIHDPVLVRIEAIRDDIGVFLNERRAEFKAHTDTLIDSERGNRDRRLIAKLQLAGDVLNQAAEEWRT